MLEPSGQPEKHMDPATHPNTCRVCDNPVTAAARFCSACGCPLDPASSAATPPGAAKWYHNMWLVLFLLFFVLGPFGLPLVWKNPRFSRSVKWVLTILMVLYTGWLTALVARMVQAVTANMQQLNSILQGY